MNKGGDYTDYQLARDRTRREIRSPARFAHADLIAYAFNIGSNIDLDEPTTYQEACQSKERDLWLTAMKEDPYTKITRGD